MARKFLYFVAALILLVLAGGIAYQLAPGWFGRMAFVPTETFVEQAASPPNAYDDPALWIARPGLDKDPSHWRPAAAEAEEDGDRATAAVAPAETPAPPPGNAAVFFVHPTSYLNRAHWNAPLEDADANTRARLYVRGMASAFADAGAVWAPRYRQATVGAFLAKDRVTAGKAIDAAYRDVEQAFDAFLAANPGRPIILAGHSQGALHLTTLLRQRFAGTPLMRRLVAAYVIGWPVSVSTDLAALGLPACTAPDQTGCLLSWASFAEPANPAMVIDAYASTIGFDGRPRRDTAMLCTNPLTGGASPDAPASANLGTLIPRADFSDGSLTPAMVPARCDPATGLLLIGPAPDVGNYVLPGNNFHVYDITLFWANTRADALRRSAAFAAR